MLIEIPPIPFTIQRGGMISGACSLRNDQDESRANGLDCEFIDKLIVFVSEGGVRNRFNLHVLFRNPHIENERLS